MKYPGTSAGRLCAWPVTNMNPSSGRMEKNPPADLTHGKRFGGGSITVKASLKNSRIEQIRFEGDFLGCMEMKDIEQLLNGVVYERDAVSPRF